LTGKGRALATPAIAVQNDVVSEMAKAYSPEDLVRVKDVMDRSSVLMQDLSDR